MAQTELEYLQVALKLPKQKPKIKIATFSRKTFFIQRNGHRSVLFWFSLITSGSSLLALFALAATQAYVRIVFDLNYEVMSETGFQIFAVAVFGQVFGVVYVIANALWSNDEFSMIANSKD